MQARHLHARLVAVNLFWYQAIRQTMSTLVVSMSLELSLTVADRARLIAAPSVGNILTQMLGGMVEARLGAKATIAVALIGMGIACILVPLATSVSIRTGLLLLSAQGFIFVNLKS